MMPAGEIETRLRRYHAKGFRELYITGGEPLLWRDGDTCLADIIRLAYTIGYFHVGLTTNGTCSLDAPADVIWVSLDGTPEVHNRLRGPHFARILRNLHASDHRGVGITCTVNALNRWDLKALLQLVIDERVAPLGVMFYFLTPYYGRDELFLDRAQRAAVIEDLLAWKRDGLPIFNSVAALKCLQSGRWHRPSNLWWLSAEDGEHMCCRHRSPEVCEECGYSSCVEIIEALRLRPSAIRALMALS
jgi:MoaA/NifB/PqqE/SkfB family radical SAM enzyme